MTTAETPAAAGKQQTTREYRKPLPMPDQDSQPYYDYLKQHELRMQWCPESGRFRFPPRIMDPWTQSLNYEWRKLSGRGRVFSCVTFHHVYGPEWADDVPYNVSMIELEEGPRLISNVIGCHPDEVYVGMPVQVEFEDITEEFTLPRFRPIPNP